MQTWQANSDNGYYSGIPIPGRNVPALRFSPFFNKQECSSNPSVEAHFAFF